MSDFARGVLIDLDDTILDDSGNVESCWADACAEATPRLPGLDAAALQRAVREYADSWWRDHERNRRGRLDLRAATREIVSEVMRRLGHDTSTAVAIANHYRDLREERTTVFPGAIETLERLRARGVRLGLMTNGAGPSQRAKIERFNLAPHFEHIVIEGEFGCGKPDPRVFQSLLAGLKVEPHETWAVGDNLEADVYGSMALGIHGIWHDFRREGLPEGSSVQPDRVIHALSELA